MNALRSLLFYWRTQLMVFIGMSVACAVLIGSMAVGDSASQSLDRLRMKRLGAIHNGIVMQGRFIHQDFSIRLSALANEPLASVLSLRGLVSNPNNNKRHPRILIHGVSPEFWSFAPTPRHANLNGLAINKALASHLDLVIGDELVVRMEKPSLLSRDAPLTPDDEALVATRMKVAHVLDDQSFGAFQLSSSLEPAMNVFLPLDELQSLTELDRWVNQIYTKELEDQESFESAVHNVWQLSDVGIDIKQTKSGSELRSQRIFIDPIIGKHLDQSASGIIGYMVNRFEHGEQKTPYSIIAGLDDGLMHLSPLQQPTQLQEDEVIINQWLAEDLKAKPNDRIRISYYELQNNNDLVEKEKELIIRDVCPITGLAADKTLMPPFPGLADKDDCREWDPGSHVELDDIREKDEAYWDDFRGTPKAFISLSMAKQLWANRFGDATAYRSELSAEDLGKLLRQRLRAEDFGLFVTRIRALSDKASSGGVRYITSVFVSLNMFLVIAAFILIALFYSMSMEQRRRESGVLFSLGFTWTNIKRRLLMEQCLLLLFGLAGGSMGALVFFGLFVGQLSHTWSDAVAGAQLEATIAAPSFLFGSLATACAVLMVCWFMLRRFHRSTATELVSASVVDQPKSAMNMLVIAVITIVTAASVIMFLPLAPNDPIRYFSGAALMLLGGLCLLNALFRSQIKRKLDFTWNQFLVLNMSRQGRRHLYLVAMLASCVFLILASSAFRMQPDAIQHQRFDGTGGFHWFGEVSLPIEKDINTKAGRDLYAIDQNVLSSAHVVHMRSNNDDEASCLNLNQSQTPRLWGINWMYLNEQRAFPFMQAAEFEQSPWELLGQKRNGRIPVIGDVNSLLWNLGKGLGSVLVYTTETGETYELEIVGLLQDTMLQGGLLMDEQYFTQMFPHINGYRYLMIDASQQGQTAMAQTLESNLQQLGLVLEASELRLARYNAVRNAYIVIFQIIGALGVALACIGLSAIILRQIMERRQEFSLMRSLGYTSSRLSRMVFVEHIGVVLLALFIGAVSAFVAIIPVAGGLDHLLATLFPLALIAGVSIISAWLACKIAMRGSLLEGLRND